MADIPSLNLDFPDIGGDENSWGEILNEIMLTTAAKANDSVSISTVGGTTILSDAQELVGSIVVTGVLASAGILEFSGRAGVWVISNETTGAYSLTARIGASGDTLEIARGKAQVFASTGTAWIGTAGAGDFVPIDGSVPMTGNLALGTHKITGLKAGTNYNDAATVLQTGGAIGEAAELYIEVMDDTTVHLTATAVTMGTTDLVPATQYVVDVSINIATVGANGRDAGSEPTNTWLAVYVIYNPTTNAVAGLLSTNFEYDVVMPSGYTHAARLGSVYNDFYGNLWRTGQRGKDGFFSIGVNPADNVDLILGGGSTGGTPINADMVGIVPPTTAAVTLSLVCENADSPALIASDGVIWSSLFLPGSDVMSIPVKSISESLYYQGFGDNCYVGIRGWRET